MRGIQEAVLVCAGAYGSFLVHTGVAACTRRCVGCWAQNQLLHQDIIGQLLRSLAAWHVFSELPGMRLELKCIRGSG